MPRDFGAINVWQYSIALLGSVLSLIAIFMPRLLLVYGMLPNVTGVNLLMNELVAKQIDVLHEAVPSAAAIKPNLAT